MTRYKLDFFVLALLGCASLLISGCAPSKPKFDIQMEGIDPSQSGACYADLNSGNLAFSNNMHAAGGVGFLKDPKYAGPINSKIITPYTQAISAGGQCASKGYNNRGEVYLLMEDFPKACADLQKACQLGICSGYNLSQKNGQCR